MRKFAIGLVTLAIYATASVVVPMVTADKAEAGSRHTRKHSAHWSPGFNNQWPAGRASPVAAPANPRGAGCPGIARGFECGTWPPPMNDDPDRKASSSDGG
jgi:hypothetical protein